MPIVAVLAALFGIGAILIVIGFLIGDAAAGLVWGLAPIALGIFLIFSFRKGREKYKATVDQVNKQHGLQFLAENGFGLGNICCFDLENKKVLFIIGKTHSIHDWSYIAGFHRDSQISDSGNIVSRFVVFKVNDWNRPEIRVRVDTESFQDLWMNRLRMMLSPG